MNQRQRELAAVHAGKDVGKAIKAHLRKERGLEERNPEVTVSPLVVGRDVKFTLVFQRPPQLYPPKKGDDRDYVDSEPFSLRDQERIVACLQKDEKLRGDLGLTLKELGLKTFEIEPQQLREGKKTLRCTLKKQ